MLPAVELDREARSWAVEVEDVWPARMLPPELVAAESLGLEAPPHRGFRVCACGAKLTATGEGHVHGSVFGAVASWLPLSLALSPLRGARGSDLDRSASLLNRPSP